MSLQCTGWVAASGGIEKSGGKQGHWRFLNATDPILMSILVGCLEGLGWGDWWQRERTCLET